MTEETKPEEKKTTVRVDLSDEDRALFDRWQDLLGFSSQREFVRFLSLLGVMSLEMTGGKPIRADQFANTLYTIGSRFFAAEFNRNVASTIEEFKRWRESQDIRPTFTATRKLNQL